MFWTPRRHPTGEGFSHAAQPVAKNRMVDGIAVGKVRVEINAIVALEKHVVGVCHVGDVQPDLEPLRHVVDKGIVHVVVAENGGRAGAAAHHGLVRPNDDAVFN